MNYYVNEERLGAWNVVLAVAALAVKGIGALVKHDRELQAKYDLAKTEEERQAIEYERSLIAKEIDRLKAEGHTMEQERKKFHFKTLAVAGGALLLGTWLLFK